MTTMNTTTTTARCHEPGVGAEVHTGVYEEGVDASGAPCRAWVCDGDTPATVRVVTAAYPGRARYLCDRCAPAIHAPYVLGWVHVSNATERFAWTAEERAKVCDTGAGNYGYSQPVGQS